MDLFTVVEDAHVILVSNGVLRQAKVYRRGNRLYAGHGSGFIGLRQGGATTVPNIRWEDTDANFKAGKLGVLEIVE
jgi:hypothetical protein